MQRRTNPLTTDGDTEDFNDLIPERGTRGIRPCSGPSYIVRFHRLIPPGRKREADEGSPGTSEHLQPTCAVLGGADITSVSPNLVQRLALPVQKVQGNYLGINKVSIPRAAAVVLPELKMGTYTLTNVRVDVADQIAPATRAVLEWTSWDDWG